jgi:hypothetical protein
MYHEDDRFFPIMIRDAHHLVPTQSSPDFHIFDYVDLSAMKQARTRHSQLYHNAQWIHKSPCQAYSLSCYRRKIIQVFDYVLQNFPKVEYYFYMEADNDLCVPMSMVQALALREQRYFINVGIGFSGWIMSRQFMDDFLTLYRNITFPTPPPSPLSMSFQKVGIDASVHHDPTSNLDGPDLSINNDTTITNTSSSTSSTGGNDVVEGPEIRPDVLASYYLIEKHAWTVTRQYWVSHTSLESLGASSLTVKDRRKEDTGARPALDKHLPRCFEPRRGKWPTGRRPLDPRDRFGWDYFDYQVCPDAMIFPCDGPDQLAQLVAEDWRIANESGAIAKIRVMERIRKARQQRQQQQHH